MHLLLSLGSDVWQSQVTEHLVCPASTHWDGEMDSTQMGLDEAAGSQPGALGFKSRSVQICRLAFVLS